MKNFFASLPLIGKAFADSPVKPDEVRAFWAYMHQHFNTQAVNKRDSLQMQAVAQVLSLLKIADRDRFLDRYTTTIGRNIYTPFEVGVPRGTWDLWDQIVVCVHEHQHVVQHDRLGLTYEFTYVTDSAARAKYEAEAYRCNLELAYWRTGKTPPVRPIAELLYGYSCSAQDVDVVAQTLALSAVSVRRGAVMNEATHVALRWLNEHLPHLRAAGLHP